MQYITLAFTLSPFLKLCLLTSSRFVRFNVSRTGARGGIWGEGVSCFLVFLEFVILGFFLIDATDENDEFVDEDRFPLSMISAVSIIFCFDLSEFLVFLRFASSYFERLLISGFWFSAAFALAFWLVLVIWEFLALVKWSWFRFHAKRKICEKQY